MGRAAKRGPILNTCKSVFDGRGTDISISSARYDELCTAFTLREIAPHLYREVAFSTAVIVCHEFVHAVQNARSGGDQCPAPGFEERWVSEQGFDWESTVFGGHISEEPLRLGGAEGARLSYHTGQAAR